MSANPDRFYWDTAIFLCFLSHEEQERRKICESILRHAKEGHVEIITSMFTVVEVIRPKAIKFPVPLTDDQVRILEGMFKWPFLKKIQVHEELAFQAVKLARTCGLRPADAIHAATAINQQVVELQAWDSDYEKVGHLIKVAAPDYLHNKGPLFETAEVGPTPADFSAPSSSGTAPPSEQSPAVEKGKEPPSVPDRPSNLHVAPGLQLPGSSPPVPPLPPSKK